MKSVLTKTPVCDSGICLSYLSFSSQPSNLNLSDQMRLEHFQQNEFFDHNYADETSPALLPTQCIYYYYCITYLIQVLALTNEFESHCAHAVWCLSSKNRLECFCSNKVNNNLIVNFSLFGRHQTAWVSASLKQSPSPCQRCFDIFKLKLINLRRRGFREPKCLVQND